MITNEVKKKLDFYLTKIPNGYLEVTITRDNHFDLVSGLLYKEGRIYPVYKLFDRYFHKYSQIEEFVSKQIRYRMVYDKALEIINYPSFHLSPQDYFSRGYLPARRWAIEYFDKYSGHEVNIPELVDKTLYYSWDDLIIDPPIEEWNLCIEDSENLVIMN